MDEDKKRSHNPRLQRNKYVVAAAIANRYEPLAPADTVSGIADAKHASTASVKARARHR